MQVRIPAPVASKPSTAPAVASSSAPRVARSSNAMARHLAGMRPLGVQAQMQVSNASDPAEKEADATARSVMRMEAPVERAAPAAPHVQRSTWPVVQRKPAGPGKADTEVAAEIRASLGGGTALPPAVRKFMEPRFKADFSGVRIHTDGKAAGLAAKLAARAFAFGKDVFFGRGEFRPETPAGKELIAHELTHTIQQRAVVQKMEAPAITQTAPPQVQRFGLDTVLDYIADKANIIPGFRLFTIVIGVNPINMAAVDPTPANILRAAIEFIPGGGLVTQALDNSGIFEKVANWAAQQMKTLAALGGSIIQALKDFIKSLGVSDFARPGATWERAKSIFSGPIQQVKSTVAGWITDIVKFVKEAILKPIGKLAEGTPAYPLLKALLGFDPVTGEPAPFDGNAVVGGLMELAGQQEIWGNVKKANAISRVVSWFQGAKGKLVGFVRQIPSLVVAAFKSLQLSDIILVPLAFVKIGKVFGGFVGDFVSWALDAGWKLLEIVFDVVSPGAWGYVKRTGAALKSILKNPLPFVGNLAKAAKLGFQNFAGNFGNHLKKGLIDWLTGSLSGVYIPKALSLGEIVKFALSVLGLTWANLRERLVKAVGETAVAAMEKGFEIVKTLVTKGPAAAWEQIKDELAAQKDKVIEGIRNMVIEAVVTKAIPKLVAMFIPGAGFLTAIISIYDLVMVFVQKISKIIAVVTAFIDSIVAIAAGNIGAATAKVESILAGLLSLAINFLAGFAGLGKIASKINGVIEKIRAPVFKAMDSLAAWIKKQADKFLSKLKSAAGALFEWWKKKVSFSDKKGKSHKLFFSGQGESARLKVASTEMFTEEFVAKVQKAFADDPLAKSFGLSFLGQAQQKKAEVDRLKAQLERENKTKAPSARFTDDKLQGAMASLAATMRPLFDVLPENKVDDLPAKPGDKITLAYKGTERMAEILFASTQRVNYEIKSASYRTALATADFRVQWTAGTIRPYVEGGSREKYLGATPGKASATGKVVIARYKTRTEGTVVLVEWSPGKWHPLSDCDMSHEPEDAVTFWNRVRKTTTPKSDMVRAWMLNPANYVLEPSGPNRSRGSRAGEKYLPP